MKRHLFPAVLVTAAACGGPAEPPAASPPPAAPPAPTAPAARAAALPPVVDEAMGRVVGLLADANDAAIASTFSPAFLSAIPPEKVKALFSSVKGRLGACKERLEVQVESDTTAVVRLQCERGAEDVTLKVSPAPPHLIERILLKPVDVPAALPPIVDEAMGRVVGLFADANDAAIQATFSPAFLAGIPQEKVKELFSSVKAQFGACKERRAVAVKGDTAAVVRLQCERGAINATVLVNPAPPHLLEGLMLKPAP